MCSVLSGGGGSGGGGGYGGFFLACEYFGDCSTNHSPPALFRSFIFLCVCVEVNSVAPISIFRPKSVHSGSVSRDNGR